MVEVPLWLLILLGGFAAVGLLDLIFVPGVRWFLRTRANRAIDELNTRLTLRIQPFKMTRRQTLVDQLMYDAEIIEEAERVSGETGEPREVVMNRAASYAREIVPHFHTFAYFKVGARAARWLSKLVYHVRLGYSDDEALKAVDRDASVVFVMNHRSNMDYVLVTYMASSSASLSYAVGEWAQVWLLEWLIKSMGAYFIRRDSGNRLYRRVLARYVRLATRQGVTQAVFPEGGLSRDGAFRPVRLGLISYMICDFDPRDERDVVFVPVGLNYDRVLEDRILTSRIEKEITGRTFKTSLWGIAKYFGHATKLRLQGKWHRHGYACVSFGTPVSLKGWLNERKATFKGTAEDKKRDLIADLGDELMGAIKAAVPVLPVSVVATVFLQSHGERMSEFEVKSRTFAVIDQMQKNGAHIYIPHQDRDYAVSVGLRTLHMRHLVKERNGLYRMNQTEMTLLNYYANAISHFL